MIHENLPIKLRLAMFNEKVSTGQPMSNASDRIHKLMEHQGAQNLPIWMLMELDRIAQLLDAYRFMAGKVMHMEDTLCATLEQFAPEKMAMIRRDVDG